MFPRPCARSTTPPPPVLNPPRASPLSPRPQVLASAWLLACYALQVPALRDLLLDRAGGGAAWMLAWAGTPLLGPDPRAGELPLPGGGRGVEALLRWKALLLAAAALWQRARRWGAGDASPGVGHERHVVRAQRHMVCWLT
jgi:hypothetical protein